MDNSILILTLALLGFLNAFFLYYQHKREIATGQKMFCIIGGDCGAVVGSRFGKTLGVKNEKIGMTFYSFILVYALIALISPGTVNNLWAFSKTLAALGIIFSFYLLYIQTMVLKKICSWCLIAIAINFIIFFLI
jgi:uncharacterized membrane protein